MDGMGPIYISRSSVRCILPSLAACIISLREIMHAGGVGLAWKVVLRRSLAQRQNLGEL